MSDNPRRDDVRHQMAARTHGDADPNPKQTAAVMDRTPRTARRWRTDGKGSPVDQQMLYLQNCPDPWRVIASLKATAMRPVQQMAKAEILVRLRELHVADPIQEGVDTSNRYRQGLSWLDRAQDSARDAAHDEEIAALYIRCAELRISETEVFGP